MASPPGVLRLLSAGSVPELSELGRNPARFPDRDCFGARFCAGYNTGPEKFWCPQRRDYRMGDRGWWGVNTESFSEFQQLINTMMKRRLKTEVEVGLPPKRVITIHVSPACLRLRRQGT